MKKWKNDRKILWILFGLLAGSLLAFVLFQPPQPGVADQGDFDRVMNASGLELKAADRDDPSVIRFLDYTTTDYEISPAGFAQLVNRLRATSLSYLITGINLACLALGQTTFKTGYLAIIYAVMYLSALCAVFIQLPIKNMLKLTLFGVFSCIVFLDGNYLVWFNSLYGEPMMITTLALYIAAWMYSIRQRSQPDGKPFYGILFIMLTAHLFLGSKLQVISALPIIIIMILKLLTDNRRMITTGQLYGLGLLFGILIAYPLGFQLMNKEIGQETKYNAVFYGIIRYSQDPAGDLEDLGLDPDLAVDAGKHAFLAKADYVKYVPHTQITENVFYRQITNYKLAKFYLTHPVRLIQGMEYTAGESFITRTFLGKYARSVSEIPVREFHRFTHWSSFREQYFPKRLWFIISMYGGVFLVSLNIYMWRHTSRQAKGLIELLWGVMCIGLLQFPMPLVGNGYADTAKQLFLFNFITDIVVVVSVCWCISAAIDLGVKGLDSKKKASAVPPLGKTTY